MAGRVALVTGGGGGIGEATGRLFAEEGAAVTLLDADAVESSAAGILSAVPGARVLALTGDVTRESDVRRIIDETAARWGARAAARGVSEAELRTQRAGDNLLGRWAEPREVAYPILFLAGDESSFVTGATLMVDAGRSIL
jgi:NAD(P)-dependent dehydrogenase (short-subunit alcohol dehydrogenase family)